MVKRAKCSLSYSKCLLFHPKNNSISSSSSITPQVFLSYPCVYFCRYIFKWIFKKLRIFFTHSVVFKILFDFLVTFWWLFEVCLYGSLVTLSHLAVCCCCEQVCFQHKNFCRSVQPFKIPKTLLWKSKKRVFQPQYHAISR